MGVQKDESPIDPVSGEEIPLKPLAHSEDEKMEYMPEAIIEGKTITIEVVSSYKIAGVVVEYNSFTRHLTLTPNDLAYTCDIEALDKKINVLAEQSHSNDAAMASIQEEYAMVNEVNEFLANNYVLKSKFPDLSEYRKLNDLLSYTDTNCLTEATFEKSGNWYRLDLNYIEGTRFEIKYEDTTNRFEFTIDEQTKQGSNDVYDHNIADGLRFRWIPRSSSLSLLYLLNSSDIILKYELLSVKYPAPDEFALKSQIEELKKENDELKATISLLEKAFWIDRTFTHITENDDNYVKLGDWFKNSNIDISNKQFRMIGYYLDKYNNKKYFDFIYEDNVDENSENYSYIYDGNQTVIMHLKGGELWVKELVNGGWIEELTLYL